MSDVSRLGRGIVVRGSIRGEGDVEIEGRIEGTLDIDGDLTLAESARIRIEEGELSGSRVSIRGAVLGNVRGRTAIVLEEGARVVGDLSAPSIGIRPGGLLRGHVATGEASPVRGRADRSARAATPRQTAKAMPFVAQPPPRPAKASRIVEEVSDSIPTRKKSPAGRAVAPAPVMPSIKKGQKGQLKRKASG